ncbi:MAG: hypothetical protein IJY01_07160 [Clostridia bacterium]|nr:hypothetical protein [Clostridia bacterium]MBQ8290628.1 hypothetical protein [Clostridia bacterium]
MKNKTYSPYATNKGGRILSPRAGEKNEPKASAIKGDDLRLGKSKGAGKRA